MRPLSIKQLLIGFIDDKYNTRCDNSPDKGFSLVRKTITSFLSHPEKTTDSQLNFSFENPAHFHLWLYKVRRSDFE